jgi:hypothetical protein
MFRVLYSRGCSPPRAREQAQEARVRRKALDFNQRRNVAAPVLAQGQACAFDTQGREEICVKLLQLYITMKFLFQHRDGALMQVGVGVMQRDGARYQQHEQQGSKNNQNIFDPRALGRRFRGN